MLNVAVLEAWQVNDGSLKDPPSRFWKPSIFGRENAAAPLTLPADNNIGESRQDAPDTERSLSAGSVVHFGDQPVVETLVISFQMVMGDVSANGRAKMILSERNDPVEALVFYRTNKPLRVSVQIRTRCG